MAPRGNLMGFTNLSGLLASLTLRERGGSDLLAGFVGRLSLRKEDISKAFKPTKGLL